MTDFGDLTVLVWVVACVYAIGLGSSRTGGKPTAILAALALGTTGFCVLVLKLLTARGADGEFHFFWAWYPSAMMFPSGHTAINRCKSTCYSVVVGVVSTYAKESNKDEAG